tara:strand:- start:790 stop:2190 length:1401 start_codon:yes stop_codon:yes gene_type:complete
MKKIAIVGAGAAGKRFIHTILSSSLKSKFTITAIFDDDIKKIDTSIHDIRVTDLTINLDKYVNLFEMIVIAIPSCGESKFNQIYSRCIKTGKKVVTIPSHKDILSQSQEISSIRDINIKDLIDRDEMPINHKNIAKAIKDKTVLITGGAGSIGSVILELCLKNQVKKIICIDSSEYNTYKLIQKVGTNKIAFETGDIKDYEMMNFYFKRYKPDIVFHAAALKHVNIQETNLRNSLLTNFFGTDKILQLSIKYNIEDFVLISTDKAVEPSNNMGLSKRLAELLAIDYASSCNMNISIVRFGNVIGSSGSVLNHFSALIKDKKDIMITDKKVKRFFMSIREACYLVLESINNSKHNCQIFMIDMGEEILIKDIAEKLIILNGLKVNKDINIVFGKLKKGEKISEKLKYDFEKSLKTQTDKLLALEVHNPRESIDFELFKKNLEDLIYKNSISSTKIESMIINEIKNFI